MAHLHSVKLDDQMPRGVAIDRVISAEATYLSSLDRLTRVAQVTQALIESAKISFATRDNFEIEEIKQDAAVLLREHEAACQRVHLAAASYKLALEGTANSFGLVPTEAPR